MTEYELDIHEANVTKYGPLPLPLWFRDGPKGADGKALDPARRRIAVYPDGTFPTAKQLSQLVSDAADNQP